jgi:hypothetical protein
MRAIIHLLTAYYEHCLVEHSSQLARILPKTVSGRLRRINGRHLQTNPNPLRKFLVARINQLQPSQNAAALLFDLGTVDIR